MSFLRSWDVIVILKLLGTLHILVPEHFEHFVVSEKKATKATVIIGHCLLVPTSNVRRRYLLKR